MQGSLMLFPEFLSVGPHCPAAHPDPILAALPPERPRTWGPGSGGAGLQAQTELASHGRQPRGLRALPPGPHSLLARCGTLLTQAVGPAEGSHGLTPSSALGQGSETLSSQRSRGKLLTSSWLAGRVSVGSQGEGHKGQLVGEGQSCCTLWVGIGRTRSALPIPCSRCHNATSSTPAECALGPHPRRQGGHSYPGVPCCGQSPPCKGPQGSARQGSQGTSGLTSWALPSPCR